MTGARTVTWPRSRCPGTGTGPRSQFLGTVTGPVKGYTVPCRDRLRFYNTVTGAKSRFLGTGAGPLSRFLGAVAMSPPAVTVSGTDVVHRACFPNQGPCSGRRGRALRRSNFHLGYSAGGSPNTFESVIAMFFGRTCWSKVRVHHIGFRTPRVGFRPPVARPRMCEHVFRVCRPPLAARVVLRCVGSWDGGGGGNSPPCWVWSPVLLSGTGDLIESLFWEPERVRGTVAGNHGLARARLVDV
jgi:hypothetical protein